MVDQDYEDLYQKLKDRVFSLNESVWERRLPDKLLEQWLDNFDGRVASVKEERLCALYIVSHFMFFGSKEIRVLLRAMYRDLTLVPIMRSVRDALGDMATWDLMAEEVRRGLNSTRFLGIGNPSESGVHLLYYFRQENSLGCDMFCDSSLVIKSEVINGSASRVHANPDVKRYVFIDDVCGSGDTAVDYSRRYVEDVVGVAPDVSFEYHCLFATTEGLRNVRRNGKYSKVKTVYELDETYKYTSPDSRYFSYCPEKVDPGLVKRLVVAYGAILFPAAPIGFSGGDLLLGFHHNTPDNTLPIIWAETCHLGVHHEWVPAFKRYPKKSGLLS